MNRRGYRSSIPKKAREVVHERYENGVKKETFYFVGRKKVGQRLWYENGEVEIEYGLKGDMRHGTEFHFNEDGELTFMEPMRNGWANGTARQWSWNDGRLLITYTLRYGVGLDLWCDDDGSLKEEHYWPDEGELGYSRWWNSDNKTVWLEYFYVLGKEYHGVTREWNNAGRLRRGFPKYHVSGQKVTKRQYVRACESDPLLLPFRPEENEPSRTLPPEFLAQRCK